MPEAILEIVELESGEVVLRRTDSSAGSSEPFVAIKFSQEAKELVNGNTAHLGRLMISMGLQMVAKMHKEAMETAMKESEGLDESLPEEDMPPPNSRLH
ncbi:hypothetical protein FK216_13055 [Moraxellaceae bacterium AER2_44_116]|nr:hypothetical protein [Moraxellaceae bacterium]TQC95994.1 hypothetical protein FK216_13055 [Moraxellaceae bacterium AER2_44_116]